MFNYEWKWFFARSIASHSSRFRTALKPQSFSIYGRPWSCKLLQSSHFRMQMNPKRWRLQKPFPSAATHLFDSTLVLAKRFILLIHQIRMSAVLKTVEKRNLDLIHDCSHGSFWRINNFSISSIKTSDLAKAKAEVSKQTEIISYFGCFPRIVTDNGSLYSSASVFVLVPTFVEEEYSFIEIYVS